ncbi:PGF-pre-PGF domain-containing protein [Halopelagius inordinatus]|uniref:PGF-pre-PGF domain-containing protein n=1 Tax=Halopelagius inordinatus TaxID=553467 RepID=A0A1I2P7W0_9EURY|nr:PGF-pre-PGF domain-containing protein [Halopelagius inordinatus]SFG12218.1 PGF-pre-PGF domain-containing protein [Halopelagius inordinatus]
MYSKYESLLGIALAAMVVLSGLSLGAIGVATATESVSEPSTSPTVTAAAETQSVGNSTNVSVGYNVSDEVDASHVELLLSNGSGTQSSAAPGTVNGTLNLTLGPRSSGGAERVVTYVINNTTSAANASATTVVPTASPVDIESYTVSDTSPAVGESVTVNATLNNTASTEQNFTVRVYKSDRVVSDADNATVTLAGDERRHVELNVTYDREVTANLTVNDEAPTEVTVGSGGGSTDVTYTSVSAANTSIPLNESGNVSVSYDLADDVTPADAVVKLRNHSATLDSNASLVDNGTVNLTVPARSVAGANRLEVVVRNATADSFLAETAANVTVAGNVSVESVTVPDAAVASAGTNVTVTLNNTGPVDESYRLRVYDDATSTYSVGTEWVFVPAGTEETYNVSAAYAEGTRTTYLGNESHGTTVVSPAATVESVTHVSGPENATALSSEITTGGMLGVDLRNGTEQDLAGTGVTESSVFEVVLHVNHSFDPGLLVANARNVSWTVENTTEHYVVTVTAQPLESQFMRDAPSLDNWDSLDDSEDRATDELLWYSISFVDERSLHNANMTNMTIATDAQTFGAPRYDAGEGTVEIDLAAPHYTVDGDTNDGSYQATIPSAMLSQWGVESADELAGTYRGESKTLSTTTNPDGSLDVAMDVHYSSGRVSLRPQDDTTSSSSSESSGSTDDGSDDADESADDAPAANGTDDGVVEATTNADGSASATVENASANETVRVRFGENDSDTASVTELGISLSNDTDSMGVDVAPQETVPNGTPELDAGGDDGASDGAVGYLSIDVSGAADEEIANATVGFEVSESKLAARNVSPEDVRLYRFHDGSWRELNTTHLGDGRFEAETPGFSVFAVGTNESATDASAETTTASTAGPSEGETVTFGAETTTADGTTESEAPGFGALPAAVALPVAAMLRRRRN